jgi:hypothetical protein
VVSVLALVLVSGAVGYAFDRETIQGARGGRPARTPVAPDRTFGQDVVAVVSTSANQFSSGIGTLLHQGLYTLDTEGAVTGLVPPFVPTGLGIDAVALLADGHIAFSVGVNGGVYHTGGFLSLRQDRIYGYDPGSGEISTLVDWSAYGIDIGTLDALEHLDDGRWAFSTSTLRSVHHSEGYLVLRPQNVYLFDPATGAIHLYVDNLVIGLPNLDAFATLSETVVVISLDQDLFYRGNHLRQENAYYRDLTTDDVSLAIDGRGAGLRSLDAIDIQDGGLGVTASVSGEGGAATVRLR